MSLWNRAFLLVSLCVAPSFAISAQSGSWLEAPTTLQGWSVFATGPVIVAAKVHRGESGPYTDVQLRGLFPDDDSPVVGIATYDCAATPGPRLHATYREFLRADGSVDRGTGGVLRFARTRAWEWWWGASLTTIGNLACQRPLGAAARGTLIPDSLVARHRSLEALSATLQARRHSDGLVSEWERRSFLACTALLQVEGKDDETVAAARFVMLIAAGPALLGENSPLMASAAALGDTLVLATAFGVPSIAEAERNPAVMDALRTRCRERVDGFSPRIAARLSGR